MINSIYTISYKVHNNTMSNLKKFYSLIRIKKEINTCRLSLAEIFQ